MNFFYKKMTLNEKSNYSEAGKLYRDKMAQNNMSFSKSNIPEVFLYALVLVIIFLVVVIVVMQR